MTPEDVIFLPEHIVIPPRSNEIYNERSRRLIAPIPTKKGKIIYIYNFFFFLYILSFVLRYIDIWTLVHNILTTSKGDDEEASDFSRWQHRRRST